MSEPVYEVTMTESQLQWLKLKLSETIKDVMWLSETNAHSQDVLKAFHSQLSNLNLRIKNAQKAKRSPARVDRLAGSCN